MVKRKGKVCAVLVCKNCDGDIKLWKTSVCETHAPLLHQHCPCPRPFFMHRIPQGERNKVTRQCWLDNLQRENFSPGTSARDIQHMGRRKDTRPTSPSQLNGSLQLGAPCDSRLQHSVTDEPNDDHSREDEADDSLPAADQLGPGIVTYQRPVRGDKGAVVSPKCLSCGCNCKAIRKMDKGVQAQPDSDQDHTYYEDSKVHIQRHLCPQHSASQTEFTVCSSFAPHSYRFFTGVSKHVFDELGRALSLVVKSPFAMVFEDQLLLTLMRLRLGLLLFDLSLRFCISTSAVSKIFCFMVSELAKFARKYLVFWLPRDVIQHTLPESFSDFPSATCIIDCFEVFIERPGNLLRRSRTFSHYESHNTAKVLHVIAPNGFIMVISKAYGGRASDRFITSDSGFLKMLAPGDEILADRGFTISDLLPHGVKLSLPSFLKGRPQLSGEDVVASRRSARLRVHVERSIRRLKCLRILKQFPCSIFAKKPLVDDILLAIAGLCNLQPLLIKK